MRVTLTDASLLRYARRFVWLELNFDNPANRDFLNSHAVNYTPSLFIVDPNNERTLATQAGALGLTELRTFLERAETTFRGPSQTLADNLLVQADELFARGNYHEAAIKYDAALKTAEETWSERDRAIGSFTWALMLSGEWQSCAETAANKAALVARDQMFGRIVLAGIVCANQGGAKPWAETARRTLGPLAAEAIALPTTVRDHKFQLYQQLMSGARDRGDLSTVKRWGELWLKEIEATKPANDDERSALDIARVDAASLLDDPERVIPALAASERAMPTNFNTPLRLAQMLVEARRFTEAIAACERGLAKPTGPLGRSWLLQTEADALIQKGDLPAAHKVLDQALIAAKAITITQARERNVEKILKTIEAIEKKSHAN